MINISAVEQRIRKVLLDVFAVLVIVLMIIITLQVVCSLLGINPLTKFQSSLPLLGKSITLNSLTELQWHLLVVIGLLPCAIVWRIDAHVRVDFLYNRYGYKYRKRVDLLGNLFLTLPFLILCIPASWNFMERAWRISEASNNSGLIDRYLVKAMLPAGFLILGAVVVLELPSLFRQAITGDTQ